MIAQCICKKFKQKFDNSLLNDAFYLFTAAQDHCSNLRLEAKDITLCQFNLKESLPTIFFYTTPRFAMVAREKLKMSQDGEGPFFNPGSKGKCKMCYAVVDSCVNPN